MMLSKYLIFLLQKLFISYVQAQKNLFKVIYVQKNIDRLKFNEYSFE